MKFITIIMLLINLFSLQACQSDKTSNDDEITIERQEDYNREDANEQDVIPLKRQNEEF